MTVVSVIITALCQTTYLQVMEFLGMYYNNPYNLPPIPNPPLPKETLSGKVDLEELSKRAISSYAERIKTKPRNVANENSKKDIDNTIEDAVNSAINGVSEEQLRTIVKGLIESNLRQHLGWPG